MVGKDGGATEMEWSGWSFRQRDAEAAHLKSCAKALRQGSGQRLERNPVRLKPREETDEAGGIRPYKGWCLDLILSTMENHWKV